MSNNPGPMEFQSRLVREEVRRASIWIGMVVAVALIALLAQPLLLILAGIVAATMLDGGARLLGRILPIGRGWRLAIVLLATTALLGWIIYFAGGQIAEQAGELQRVLIAQTNQLLALGQSYGMGAITIDAKELLGYAAGSVGQVTAVVGSVVGGITALLMIAVLGIFIAIEPRLYERGFAWLLPISERPNFYVVTDAMGYTLRRLMAGRLLGMAIEGVATWLLLSIYGIPMAALLGIITGLLVFLPNIGALISGVLMVLVGFSTGVEGGLYALAVYFVVQTVDGNIIVPMVAKRTVDLAPAVVLGAQLLFGALFGLMGLALADPLVALLKVALEKNAERKTMAANAPDTVVEAPAAKKPARAAKPAATKAPKG